MRTLAFAYKIIRSISFSENLGYLQNGWSGLLLIHYMFFLEATLFSTQPQCCLTFSCIELQMLLRCCLIHVTIILLRQILYLVYFCSCLGTGLCISFLCDLLYIFSLIFIGINHTASLKQMQSFFVDFLKYLLLFLNDNVD